MLVARADAKRLAPLDGLRGLAVLAVIALHAGVLPIGWIGVDLFFALSGYLITGIVLDAKGAPRGEVYRAFYTRRALRIFPLAFAFLALLFLTHPVPLRNQIPYWLYLSNFRTATPGALVNVRHFWSLAVEEQFYILWPTVAFFLSSSRFRRVCVALVVSALIIRCALVLHPVARLDPEHFTFARLDGLVAGAFLASWHHDSLPFRLDRLRGLAGYGILAVCAAMLLGRSTNASALPMLTIGLSVVGVTMALIVAIAVADTSTPFHRLLVSPVLGWFGTVSYGLYVIHAPVAIWVAAHVAMPQLRFVFVLAASTALAAMSWYAYERPVLSLKRFWPMPAAPLGRRVRAEVPQNLADVAPEPRSITSGRILGLD
jgi:peptidoglycan/LPS O-acetylase OafA/YrhL